jgi:hypothetical protein
MQPGFGAPEARALFPVILASARKVRSFISDFILRVFLIDNSSLPAGRRLSLPQAGRLTSMDGSPARRWILLAKVRVIFTSPLAPD